MIDIKYPDPLISSNFKNELRQHQGVNGTFNAVGDLLGCFNFE
jgi:hypothetical protein